MNPSSDDLPPALSSLWRSVKLGYRAEPRLLSASFAMMVFTAIPDAMVALWLKLLADGVTGGNRQAVFVSAIGLGVSATATWFMTVVFDRVQRRFRDRVGIALESHVAHLQASIATIEHQERPDYLDRLSVLRDQVFTLDHLYMSLFTTLSWIIRLAVTVALLASIHPALVILVVFAIPTVASATWRPGVERAVEESNTHHNRFARHLFVVGTTAAPGKEVRVAGIGAALVRQRRQAWEQWYRPVASARWVSAMWSCATWSVFALAYVGAIVFVANGLKASAGSVLLVLAAGSRLSQYVGATVGELGFLRGIWLYSARRLAWLEDYAAAADAHHDHPVPDRLRDGISFEHVTFRYPGTERVVLDDVSLQLPPGTVVAIVGENGAGKSTLVKLLCRLYAPTSGRIAIDDIDLATISVEGWRARLAGAFQDFYRFELPAQKSVGVGDLDRLDDRPAVETAVGRAGADDVVTKLAHGLDTQLGATWDDGVEVSFGQWQKLALARGFMRDNPIAVVLDEPTAALDAETEHALFERYAEESRSERTSGTITILVSHRFSTVRMADLIVVLDGAHLVEFGSHAELMEADGHYAELYNIQAGAFR